jgi:hypothetical protein
MSFMLNVTYKPFMPNVIMVNDIMLNGIKVIGIMLSVMVSKRAKFSTLEVAAFELCANFATKQNGLT